MTGRFYGRLIMCGILSAAVLMSGCANNPNVVSEGSAGITSETPAESADPSARETAAFETEDGAALYHYCTQIPPEYNDTYPAEYFGYEIGEYGFTTNPRIFSCSITDRDISADEKIAKAANFLAEEYIKDFCSESDKYSFCILDYRNIRVDFLLHTVDRGEYEDGYYTVSNTVGDMEVSENAWVIDFQAEIKFTGQFGAVSDKDPGYDDWTELPLQGMSQYYLLYRDGDTFYLWSRDVYRYERVLPPVS